MDHDIVGLSILEVSGKYKTKFNTLRQHLYLPEHPIVKLLTVFRDTLMEYLGSRSKAINKGSSFYEKEHRMQYLVDQNKKLLDYVVKEIKSFVSLMHDAVIRFY